MALLVGSDREPTEGEPIDHALRIDDNAVKFVQYGYPKLLNFQIRVFPQPSRYVITHLAPPLKKVFMDMFTRGLVDYEIRGDRSGDAFKNVSEKVMDHIQSGVGCSVSTTPGCSTIT